MGYNNENSDEAMEQRKKGYLVVDLETVSIEGVEEYLDPIEAPSNYSKPEAIQGYKEKALKKAIDAAALDLDLARIVVLGTLDLDGVPNTCQCLTEKGERDELHIFWDQWETLGRPVLVTFFGSQYDIPLLVRRSQYLGVPVPKLELTKYRHPDVLDLCELLTFGWSQKSHSLGFYARRFGITHDDSVKGSDVGRLVAEGNIAAVKAHCADDLNTSLALAQRLGVI